MRIFNSNSSGIVIINGKLSSVGFSGVQGNNQKAIDERVLAPFSGIIVKGSASVICTISDSQKVVVEADSNLLELISTEVRNNILFVTTKGSYSTSNPINIVCSTPALLTAEVSGSGDIDIFELNQETITLHVSGSGDITAQGRVTEVSANVRGSGDIDCTELIAAVGRATLNGSGDIRISCNERITADCNGSGDIKVYGKPAIQNTHHNGSGAIKIM